MQTGAHMTRTAHKHIPPRPKSSPEDDRALLWQSPGDSCSQTAASAEARKTRLGYRPQPIRKGGGDFLVEAAAGIAT